MQSVREIGVERPEVLGKYETKTTPIIIPEHMLSNVLDYVWSSPDFVESN